MDRTGKSGIHQLKLKLEKIAEFCVAAIEASRGKRQANETRRDETRRKVGGVFLMELSWLAKQSDTLRLNDSGSFEGPH